MQPPPMNDEQLKFRDIDQTVPLETDIIKQRRWLRVIFSLVLVLCIAYGMIYLLLLRIERVTVVGCNYKDPLEVVEYSGLHYGMNMLFINKDAVEKAINEDIYLVFQDLQRDYSARTVILTVYERVPVCTIQTLGMQCMLDVMGVVLELTENIEPMNGMIVLTGLGVKDFRKGQTVSVENYSQYNAYLSVMYEIVYLNCAWMITEVSVLDPGNIYLELVNGMSVRLGDATLMRAKLIALLTVLDELANMGITEGMVDVSSPVYPVYIP
jgi:cell division septal protein FtsQ